MQRTICLTSWRVGISAAAQSVTVLGQHRVFVFEKNEIAENGYDLSVNRYKKVVCENMKHVPPKADISGAA